MVSSYVFLLTTIRNSLSFSIRWMNFKGVYQLMFCSEWFQDSYGNPTGGNLDGKVNVSIKNLSGENKPLPLFEGKTSSCQLSLKGGKLHIPVSNRTHHNLYWTPWCRWHVWWLYMCSSQRLTVMEKSPGEDGSSYTLVFKPEGFTLSTPLEPYELLFHFYNGMTGKASFSTVWAGLKLLHEYEF